jgi:hypothetical protein
MRRRAVASVLAVGGSASALIGGSIALGATPRGVLPIRAFERPAKAADMLPSSARPTFNGERVVASRRVAVYTDRRRRRSALYVFVTSGKRACVFLVGNVSAGGGCNPHKLLFTYGSIALEEGKYLAGVASNRVRKVVLIGRTGARHAAVLSADNGFIYDCRAWNGCAGLIVQVDAYDAQSDLIASQRLR